MKNPNIAVSIIFNSSNSKNLIFLIVILFSGTFYSIYTIIKDEGVMGKYLFLVCFFIIHSKI